MPKKDKPQPPMVTGLDDLVLLNKIRGGTGMVDKLVGATIRMTIKQKSESSDGS